MHQLPVPLLLEEVALLLSACQHKLWKPFYLRNWDKEGRAPLGERRSQVPMGDGEQKEAFQVIPSKREESLFWLHANYPPLVNQKVPPPQLPKLLLLLSLLL